MAPKILCYGRADATSTFRKLIGQLDAHFED